MAEIDKALFSDELHKQTILIADDTELNRNVLRDMLCDEFNLILVKDGVEALDTIMSKKDEIDLVLLDIVMPRADGFEVLKAMKRYRLLDSIPVIMITVYNDDQFIEKAFSMGVTDYISRPFNSNVVHKRVVNTILMYAKQKKLMRLVQDQVYQRQKSNSIMINMLSHIVEFRNGESGLHVIRINNITELLCRKVVEKTDRYRLTEEEIFLICTASSMHDIGKIAIPAEILNKPGKLTKSEFDIMKTHTMIGAQMLENIPFYQNEPLIKTAYDICRWHHERYDGGGYPDGLVGDEIPISAQIVSIADVYDSLVSLRVYKPAYAHEKAMQMIYNGESGVFNPFLLECLSEIADTLKNDLEKMDVISQRFDLKKMLDDALKKEI
ncbi:MAG: response regulator [Lachnospiraceae bacterium]|nr:response regulator [Lachnospiraceae bacterium]MCR5254739.1 response regulator [Acetatifactor sp.]